MDWIGVSPGNRGTIQVLDKATCQVGTGLAEDYRTSRTRQITLIQAEHLPVIGALLRRDPIRPEEMRRNLVVSGINLLALNGRKFRVGAVVLLGTEPCDPCWRIEEALGAGGYNACAEMGGLIATVVEPGQIAVGDSVTALRLD